MIGIESAVEHLDSHKQDDDGKLSADGECCGKGKVVFDFNCGGMFRAWMEEGRDGSDRERMMVFRDEYYS